MKPRHIVVLTGAGMSAESGLRTFRDHDELWADHRVEEVAAAREALRAGDLVVVGRLMNESHES
jgi:NAD-dependent deacetylase